MKALLLNGGKGARLGLTDRLKPVAPVCGQPLLAAGDTGFLYADSATADGPPR
jgi:hypothetical protein